jgi:hypothetical protein
VKDSREAGEERKSKEKYYWYESHSDDKNTSGIHCFDCTGARYRKRKNTGILSAHHFPIGLEVTIALSSIFDRNGHLCFSAPAFESTWFTVEFS